MKQKSQTFVQDMKVHNPKNNKSTVGFTEKYVTHRFQDNAVDLVIDNQSYLFQDYRSQK